MRYDFAPYAPMGFPIRQEINLFGFGLGASFSYFTITFLSRFSTARNALYEFTFTGKRILIEGAKMPDFSLIIRYSYGGFVLVSIFALAAILYHYLYHKQGSKSIYLMRRLPDRWELHKRCFTIPCLVILASILCALFLILLFYIVYLTFTPNGCLPDSYLQLTRSVLL